MFLIDGSRSREQQDLPWSLKFLGVSGLQTQLSVFGKATCSSWLRSCYFPHFFLAFLAPWKLEQDVGRELCCG